MSLPPKCHSVTEDGKPDGFSPPLGFRGEVSPDGTTRLVISADPDRLCAIHRALVELMEGPLGVLYVQLTDRRAGVYHEDGPKRFLGLELPARRVLDAADRCRLLLFGDGRHQLWLRGALREQLVLDEMGQIYVYPDDFSFRDRLEELGVPELDDEEMMCDRDYVKVAFQARADGDEDWLIRSLNLQPAEG